MATYGRVYAVFSLIFEEENWRDFDAWCLIKNIEPLELPAYRFFNLAVFFLKEGKNEEQLEALEESLLRCDSIVHPFLEQIKVESKPIVNKQSSNNEHRQNAPEPSDSRKDYVPSWWRGDSVNYKIAKTMMMTLPTKVGPQKG